MSMRIDQEYVDEYVIKPIMKKFDELEQLIKNNDKETKMKIGWMSDNIAKLPKTKKRKK